MTKRIISVTIEEMPRKRLLGNWMHLNAARDRDEYSEIWQAFTHRVRPFLGKLPGYGICVDMGDDLDCNYWTAIEAPPGQFSPPGMAPITLASGCYACLITDGNAALADAYQFLYNSWNMSETAYSIDSSRPCFEVFGPDWDRRENVKFFMPLIIKSQYLKMSRPRNSSMEMGLH